jgi:hypothetical protein
MQGWTRAAPGEGKGGGWGGRTLHRKLAPRRYITELGRPPAGRRAQLLTVLFNPHTDELHSRAAATTPPALKRVSYTHSQTWSRQTAIYQSSDLARAHLLSTCALDVLMSLTHIGRHTKDILVSDTAD